MKYFYYVAYTFTSKNYASGIGLGSVEMEMLEPITKIDHVRSIENWIIRNNKDNVTCHITNFILLRTEEAK